VPIWTRLVLGDPKKKKENDMTKNSRTTASKVLVTALLMSLSFIATLQAQTELPPFTGKFTLTTQVQWNKTLLQPGDYTIAIATHGATFALVRDSEGRPVARFISAIDGGGTSDGNALLIREKGGQLRVYSLELASLGRVLVYDPALAREAVMEARVFQKVPVMLAKR
jgi:hypothetical protein